MLSQYLDSFQMTTIPDSSQVPFRLYQLMSKFGNLFDRPVKRFLKSQLFRKDLIPRLFDS